MKKLALCSSLLAVLAIGDVAAGAPEGAMHLSRDGLGQVLVFPYYTVNSYRNDLGGRQTLISISNTTERAKAARLFFYEAQNSRIVAEVTIFLTPFDTWTGTVFAISESGGGNLATFDRSCTFPEIRESTSLPQIPNGPRYLPFSNAGYSGDQNDSGPDDLARSREGHMVLFELGEIVEGGQLTLAAITPDETGVPANCAQVASAWEEPNGYWTANSFADFAPPGGGLSGSVYPIDAHDGTMQLIQPDAIANFTGLILNERPGQGGPTLASNFRGGPVMSTIAVDLFLDGIPTTLQYELGPVSIEAVSALFMAESIHNEFVTSASLGGASEWVVNFPTKRHYITGAGPEFQALPPFSHAFPITGDLGKAPVAFAIEAWTRDGVVLNCIPPYTYEGCIVGTPPPSQASELNYVTNVVSFNQQELGLSRSLILGAEQSVPIDFFDIFDGGTLPEGSMTMRFADAQAGVGPRLSPDLNGRRLYGMPVQGFWVTSYTNTAVTPGILANYSDAMRHFVKQAATPAVTGSGAGDSK